MDRHDEILQPGAELKQPKPTVGPPGDTNPRPANEPVTPHPTDPVREADGEPAVHDLHLLPQYFDLVADGTKTIEVRVATPRKLTIRHGDLLRFTTDETTHIEVRVTRATRYDSFSELLAAEPLPAVNRLTDQAGALRALRDIYSPEREALGVLAIEFTSQPTP
ncbi:ASCH domain-containing protein [Kitasatospora sp. NBC_00070]|uniref:ASCH domain-containing protein n=1 Tax=Kitasatospora sp. NBC_00070 TaxID=2975962 RepID=UPI003249007C